MQYLAVVSVAGVMVVAPLIARLVGNIAPIPLPVFELVLGILIGPAVLRWAHVTDFLSMMSNLGGAMLFFVAGTEVDARAIGKHRLTRAVIGWSLAFLVMCTLAAVLLGELGKPAFVIAIALSSTALGMLLPALKDIGELSSPFGHWILAAGAVGEFGPLVAIAILLTNDSLVHTLIVLLIFAVVATLGIGISARLSHDRLHQVITESQHTSGQFAIRVVLLLLAMFIAVDSVLGLDHLLGAFVAGAIFRILMAGAPHADAELVENKLQSIAFGFLVPVFFIVAGINFPFRKLLEQPSLWLILAGAAATLLIVRGGINMLCVPRAVGPRNRIAIGVLTGSALPVIIAATGTGYLDAGWSAALIGGGILSLLLYPAIGFGLHRRSEHEHRSGTAPETEALFVAN